MMMMMIMMIVVVLVLAWPESWLWCHRLGRTIFSTACGELRLCAQWERVKKCTVRADTRGSSSISLCPRWHPFKMGLWFPSDCCIYFVFQRSYFFFNFLFLLYGMPLGPLYVYIPLMIRPSYYWMLKIISSTKIFIGYVFIKNLSKRIT